jgi:hypothetical protein
MGNCALTSGPLDTGEAAANTSWEPQHRTAYRTLMDFRSPAKPHPAAEPYLRSALQRAETIQDGLPDSPQGLAEWMKTSADKATAAYARYLAQRKAGAQRRFFSNRSHALNFLQAVGPTKLVDGAWLFGVLRFAQDPRLFGLAQTYLEELGNGDMTKNHVLLYRQLLASLDLDERDHLDDAYFEQGAIQLALAHSAEAMLPEIIGFNLGYEQLPLHLMITAFELDELGLDPYYFTLHVTVDNADSGHARKAIDAVALNASRYLDAEDYWQRIRKGFRLNDLGVGTEEAISRFDIAKEVIRIFTAKSVAGAGAHSNYCRVEGLTVNQWLSDPDRVGDFLVALERKGWIRRGGDPRQCRFWNLLVGDRAEMFGVFSDYELQVIFDWMRGEDSTDGLRFTADMSPASGLQMVRSFRAKQRMAADSSVLDGVLAEPLAQLALTPEPVRQEPLHGAFRLTPEAHWTPEGLKATRELVAHLRGI